MKEMKIIYKKVEDIIPYENNPRNNENAIEYVANSIKEFGFKNPIIIDKDNVIVAGHTRLEASKRLGLTEVPCVTADDLTEEQVKAFRIADNKTGEQSEWNLDKLKLELEDLDLDMTEFGFGDFELTMLTDDIEPDGYDNELIDEYTETDESGVDKGLKSFNVIISCLSDEEQEWLGNLLKENGKPKRLYECKELISRFENEE